MCTSIIRNGKKTIVGFNLDLLDMKYKVVCEKDKVYIAVFDEKEGYLPLFGANNRGDFVAMPTCWPYDSASDGVENSVNIINLDIDLLLKNKSFDEIRQTVKTKNVSSVKGITFQAQLTDKNGDVLQIIPGQGYNYYKKPDYEILTNFSPFKGEREKHPWMGLDRYDKAKAMLESSDGNSFGVSNCFGILKAVSQEVCPTVVSIVFDVTENTVYWCENRQWENINKQKFE